MSRKEENRTKLQKKPKFDEDTISNVKKASEIKVRK